MKNKGQIGGLIFFFLAVAFIIVAGIFLVFISGALNFVADTVVPEIQGIGTVGDTNITQVSEYAITPINTVIQNLTWLGGAIYVIMVIGLFGLAFTFRLTKMKVLMALFVGFAILMVFVSIIISNMYEDAYNDDGDFGSRLKEQTLLSYMILHSPMIFVVVIFVSGIIMFTGVGEDDFI